MAPVQIDVANLRAALADHHNLVWSLVDEVRLDQRNNVEIAHAVRPAAFAWAKRHPACKDFVIRLLIDWIAQTVANHVISPGRWPYGCWWMQKDGAFLPWV